MLNRIAVSGGSYDDWLQAVWAHDSYSRAETPIYLGGLSKEVIFQEVISNSAAINEPLGTLAGRGALARKHVGGHISVRIDEPSYIIGIVSLTPRIDYSQGNNWDMELTSIDDLHKPALDQIGFQELLTDRMAFWDVNLDETNDGYYIAQRFSAGKQPAWIDYMTNFNKCYGNFADPRSEMFMTLNRRYEWEEVNSGTQDYRLKIKDLTTYVDPSKYNYMFADTNLSAQNFWVQIASDIIARRKMSAKVMPNL
ncbi:putative VP1-2 [Microviridae sp.]|nr:putative VP1-2 [Microviridae sp.]